MIDLEKLITDLHALQADVNELLESNGHPVEDLVAVIDIADRLKVGNTAVSNWRVRTNDFPEPLTTVGRGNTPLYSWSQVREWARRTGRLPS